MSIVNIENIVKTYGEKVLFDEISFTIEENQKIGLIGVNGTGKSTLLKVIAGIEHQETGKITHANQFRIEYLSQNPELDENLTVIEQVYYGDSPLMKVMRSYESALSRLEYDPASETKQADLFAIQQEMDEQRAWEANTTAKTILTKLGITDFFQSVKFLSGGQKKRVAIAKALIQPADLLLLDEPTNHLDHETVEWLEQELAGYKGAFVLVTHDRYFLNRAVHRMIELDQGKLYSYQGNYETYLEKKAEREEQKQTAEHKRQNLLRRELAWLRRGAKARTTKQKARIQRVGQIQDEQINLANDQVEMAIGSNRLGKKVIELKQVSKSFAGKTVIEPFDYLFVPKERVGIIGANGTGKTTFLNLIAGRIKPDQGQIDIGSTVKIGYYTQENLEMNENLRVIEYIKEEAEVIATVEGQIITAEQMLERFMFQRESQWTYIRKLSGGERRRLYLLRTLMSQPNVLLLDEPTNDLDIQTLTILEDYLEHFPGVVVTVSHDRYFLDRVVDHLIVVKAAGEISRYSGSYTDYIAENKQTKQETKVMPSDTGKKSSRKKLSYKDQRDWEEIETRIEKLEATNERLQMEIVAAGSDEALVAQLYKEQQKVELDIEAALERWTELSMLIDELEGNNH